MEAPAKGMGKEVFYPKSSEEITTSLLSEQSPKPKEDLSLAKSKLRDTTILEETIAKIPEALRKKFEKRFGGAFVEVAPQDSKKNES